MKRKITIAVLAMAISLSGIIVLQIYWINGAIEVRAKQFDGQVFDAINDVGDKLQVHESLVILPKILPGMDSMQRKTADSVYQHRMADPRHRGIFGFGRRHHRKSFIDDPFKPRIPEFNPVDSEHSVLRPDGIFPRPPRGFHNHLIPESDFRDSILADSGRRLIHMANMFSRMLREMKLNYIKENRDIDKRLTKSFVDSLLQHEFMQRGIVLPYESAILDKQTGLLHFTSYKTDSVALKSTIYRVKLFQDDMVPQSYFLVVNFPDKRGFVLRSIGLVLPGSFAFMLIIIISCGFTVYMLLKQKRLSEMKNDFINNMTHEFKTPIATISLATDAINNPKVYENKEKLMQYSSIIKEENNRMNMQVQKVLNAAVMDKEDFKLNLDKVDAHEVIQKLIDRFRIQISERNGSLSWSGNAKQFTIYADEVHFGNVINNLLDNANKYSPDTPFVKVYTYNEGKDLVIAVEDHGMGIARETQKRIFDKFYRMSTGNLHDTKGFGLGLSYVKAVITAHKGNIDLKSELKRGSTFTVKFPLYGT